MFSKLAAKLPKEPTLDEACAMDLYELHASLKAYSAAVDALPWYLYTLHRLRRDWISVRVNMSTLCSRRMPVSFSTALGLIYETLLIITFGGIWGAVVRARLARWLRLW